MGNRPNIKQHLADKPKPTISIDNIGKEKNIPAKPSIIDNPIFKAAIQQMNNLPPKIKFAIGGVLYLVLMGAIGTVYFLYQLMLLFI